MHCLHLRGESLQTYNRRSRKHSQILYVAAANLAGAKFIQFYMALPWRSSAVGAYVFRCVLSFTQRGFIALFQPAAHLQIYTYYRLSSSS